MRRMNACQERAFTQPFPRSGITQYKEQDQMQKPTLEQIDFYCREKHSSVDPIAFFLHYETNGWMVGKVPMKNWKAGIANWDRMQQTRNGGNQYAKQLPETFAERDSRSTIEAARRIAARTAGTGY